MKRIAALAIAATLLCLLCSTSDVQAADPINGKWKVYTVLETAQHAINEGYKPGDVRLEAWRIKAKGRSASLTTPSGTITGVKVGKAWVFDQQYEVYYPVALHMHIVARIKGAGKLRGTIEARYWDVRYDSEIAGVLAIDAWTFSGTKRK